MAGKRTATSDLNHDNWNQDEEPEERGTFKKASDDALKNRIIKTARRRNPIHSEDGKNKSAFVGFTGFSTKPTTSGSDFSFLKDLPKSAPKTNGIDTLDTHKTTTTNIFATSTSTTTNAGTSNIFGASIVPSLTTGSKKSENYCSRLKGLNESVSKWIVEKVEENPLISLQPIFKDYEKYLEEIDNDDRGAESTDTSAKSIPTFNFAPTTEKTKNEPAVSTFQFEAPSATAKPTFSFGSSNASKSTFSFGGGGSSTASAFSSTSSGFSFGNTPKPEEEKNENETDAADDEPPKVEFKPVVESDHVYTVKCKVFVKKGDNFGDRGVGNLYLKPVENSEKVQLIVRADTNLGNLLLNFILAESVPTKRLGKRDVMLIAIPTPDAQPPPVPVLIRVKSPEEADNLLQTLDKHKK